MVEREKMQVEQVLRMNEGVGEASYAQNSLVQEKAISMAKPIKEEAIRIMHSFFPAATSFAIADLGCSSGPNAFLVIKEIIIAIHKIRRELGNQLPVDFQTFLNDLPGNDFNTIFKSFPSFRKQLKNETGDGFGGCFAYGAPGSFYDRLFEPHSLHFIHSSYSLHYLSQVPKGIGRSNKSNITLSSSSPASVINAYYKQFQTDFSTFLKYRSEELLTGGCMVLTFLGRKRDDEPCSKEGGYIWQLLALTLHQMVSEGLIEEEKLDLFNVPFYSPSPTEIEIEVKKEGSFVINRLQVSEVDWDAANYVDDIESSGGSRKKAYVGVVKCVRAVTESMLADHFGQGLMDEFFRRYGVILRDCMGRERTYFNNLTVSLTKIM